jgi:hypothetical protein
MTPDDTSNRTHIATNTNSTPLEQTAADVTPPIGVTPQLLMGDVALHGGSCIGLWKMTQEQLSQFLHLKMIA